MLHQQPQHDRRRRRNGEGARRRLFCRGLSLIPSSARFAAKLIAQPIVAFLVAFGCCCFGANAAAQSPANPATTSSNSCLSADHFLSADQARGTVQSLFDMAITMLPHQYEGKKDWEETKKVWAGVKLRRNGFKLSTKRRWRELRHGRQVKYQISFPGDESSAKPVVATVHSVYPGEGPGENPYWVIQCELSTPLDFRARVERWNLGVQLFSVEISGHMKIRLKLHAHLTCYPDCSVLPPAVVIDPEITNASLHLDEVNVDRVSKIGGDVAETWGEIAEKITEEIFMDDLNEKLHTKLNKAIDKKRDSLRFSASDWISQFTNTPSTQ